MQQTLLEQSVHTALEDKLFENAEFKRFLETTVERSTLLDAIAHQVIDSAVQYRNHEESYANESILDKVYTISISDEINSHLLDFMKGTSPVTKLAPLNEALLPFGIKIGVREFMDISPKTLKLGVSCYAS